MSTLFLINPHSAKIRKIGFHTIEKLIYRTYMNAGKPVEIRKIEFEKLGQWIQDAPAENIQNIFAVGGDGTANSIGIKIIDTPLNFGVIPMGSGNGFARTIGFSTNLRLAVKQSLNPQVIKADTGVFGSHKFINVAGVGADTEVVSLFRHSKIRGIWSYIYYATKVFFTYPVQDIEIYADDMLVKSDNIWSVSIMNGTQWGYDARISPEASLTDGKLELIIMKKIPITRVFQEILKLYNGNIVHSAYVSIYPCKKLRIVRKNEGAAQIDGEYIEEGKSIDAAIHEKSLNLLLPSTLTADKKASI
ncbi:MAG: hypothetical protein K1X92_11940 [Bacteroidia bacterium]|nr:hypothetical protein [Bacteroidia bacterium]